MEDFEKKIRAYALKNALAYGGRAKQEAVISSLFHEGLRKDEISKNFETISEIIKEVNSLSLEKQKNEFERLKKSVSKRPTREGLIELPKTKEEKVIMRFAPSPSGPLHAGHALTASLSFLYVKKYGGQFFIRVEDTNPENIYRPAYEMIEDDTKWLFGDKIKIIIQSDRMEIYYKYAEKLINKKAAYICNCSSEKFKKFSNERKNCPCRETEINENIERWEKMLNGDFNQGEAVLRFKSGMQNKNPAFRDFPLARINLVEHPRQGKKYKVWPLMNFAVAVDDIEMNMTHVIRAKDHRDNAERQKKIFNALGLGKKFPWTGFLGRFKFKDLELSTTKFREGIENRKYSGWDDEKLPTISSLKKKYKSEAFHKFAEQIGLSENDKVIEQKEFFLLLNNFNK